MFSPDVTLPHVEPNGRRIRATRGHHTVVDTTESRYVWEHRYWPSWFFPLDALGAELQPSSHPDRRRGERRGVVHHDLVIGGDVLEGAARTYPDEAELAGLAAVDWSAVDHWYEEEVEAYIHPRSPYVRIDALPSSRHVVVRVDGEVIADTTRPTILYETGLPARYYIPTDDVRRDLLTPTESRTGCPYKGFARYWSVTTESGIHEELAWAYDEPLPESAAVRGLICFYNERVDLEVDGVSDARPHTKFS